MSERRQYMRHAVTLSRDGSVEIWTLECVRCGLRFEHEASINHPHHLNKPSHQCLNPDTQEDDAEQGCPAIGVWGIHSNDYLEGEGICQWCGATPTEDDALFDSTLEEVDAAFDDQDIPF